MAVISTHACIQRLALAARFLASSHLMLCSARRSLASIDALSRRLCSPLSPSTRPPTATKLWSYCQRPADKYGRREACEVAAATAERLFRRAARKEREGYDYKDRDYETYYGEDGTYSSSDESEGMRRRKRRDRRRRRSSVGMGYTPQMGVGASAMAGAAMIPVQAAAAGYPVTPHLWW